MANYGDFHYFAYIGNNKNFGFRTYRDPRTGMERGYCIGKDRHGSPIYKQWQFNNDSMRIKRVGKYEKDLNEQLAVDFLRESPGCYRSENGYQGPDGKQVDFYFKEVNDALDAKLAIDSRKSVIEAGAEALKLKGKELQDIGYLIGVFSNVEEILAHRVLDYSQNKPTEFLELIKNPSREVRSLIRVAVHNGIFKEEGRMITWETKTIGFDEDEAVTTLMKDDKLRKAVESNIAKFGQKVTA